MLDRVARAPPSLSLTLDVSKKAERVGFEWPNDSGAMEKLREEVRGIEEALQSGDRERVGEELGDALFTLVNVARWRKVDAELALRDMVARFSSRFRVMETLARERGLNLQVLEAGEWDALWNEAKVREME